jgi:group I intron endonuclease
MGYVYLITNTIDNKKYVGQCISSDIHERWKGHLKKSSNCRYLKHAFEKYGVSQFKFQIICICFDEDCDKYEGEYMNKYNTIAPNGYNLRQAGNNGFHNNETKEKIRATLKAFYANFTDQEKEEYAEKHRGKNNKRFGVKLSEQEKQKLSMLMKEQHKLGKFTYITKPVNQYSLDNQFIAAYKSLTEASTKLNIQVPYISMCCNNVRKSAKGFIFKFT